jgi:hypothetical protein
MGEAAGDFGAIGEATVFLYHFRDLLDPRQRGKVTYPLAEVLLLCLLAVLAGADSFVDSRIFRSALVLSRGSPARQPST